MRHKKKMFFDGLAASWDSCRGDQDLCRIRSVFRKFGIRKGDSVLEAGCGTGVILPLIRKAAGNGAFVVAADISREMLMKAAKKQSGKTSFIQADIESLPIAKNVFDIAICFSCFPHFEDKKRALSEIIRILKPGGRVVVAHSDSRESIRAVHAAAGGAVAKDVLPCKKGMAALLRGSGYVEIQVAEAADSYLAFGTKPRKKCKVQSEKSKVQDSTKG
jgi:ubiquinone/menaquinone biosynthesis C-methylase UbiE